MAADPMETADDRFDVLFLGSGNAFGAEGRAFSSFLLNGRYLFDVGPTVLQQLKRAQVPADDIDVVVVSHFHADHYFGLPFLFLELWKTGRTKDLHIVGPPGIADRSERLMELGFARLPAKMTRFECTYTEVRDGFAGLVGGLDLRAATVDHVPQLECFAYQVRANGRSLTYSGDSKLCDGLLGLADGADVLVIEYSRAGDPVHLSAADVPAVRRRAAPAAKTVVTHLEGGGSSQVGDDVLVATDLARFRL